MAMHLNHLKGFLTTLSYVVAVLAMGTLVTLLLTALGGQAQPETWRLEGGIKVLTDIKYAEVDGAVLRLNAVLPEESVAKPYPMVVYFHGGAWRTGNRRSGMRYLLPLARAGYVCFSADYRLTSQARFPAPINTIFSEFSAGIFLLSCEITSFYAKQKGCSSLAGKGTASWDRILMVASAKNNTGSRRSACQQSCGGLPLHLPRQPPYNEQCPFQAVPVHPRKQTNRWRL